jgi:hypothetical protein
VVPLYPFSNDFWSLAVSFGNYCSVARRKVTFLCGRKRIEGVPLAIYCKLMWIVLLAFAARFAVRGYFGEADFWINGYTFFFDLAQNIAAGDGYAFDSMPATAFRVPLYPLFLAAVTFGHRLFLPITLAQSLVGVGTVWCAAMLAREIFDNKAALIAAILTAI